MRSLAINKQIASGTRKRDAAIIYKTMIHGPATPLEQRTNRDIIVTIIATFILGSIIIVGTLAITLPRGNLFSAIWGIGGASFVATIIAGNFRAGTTELRRRRRSMIKNQEHQPPI
jgi:hypothetical protein